ncbi:fructose-specific PTS transporter subunit EIIC [Vibrio hannami]|uniref:fructose-specific PTS transporter subunit EIIC n=1 Tax=Vibrio hannami TaxID=2717094 RepID=UPI00241088F6|nr:fructose-specific PTS transporter subunit EIIC [Vibrio hannami]MDG3085335.1 fructose-specific PTS transporter subunit EIIC [Vibrio hannami]
MNLSHLVEPNIVCLALDALTKDDVFLELSGMLEKAGKLNDQDKFLSDIKKREEIGNTGFEDGIAIPHAKSDSVSEPAIAIGISRKGIAYGVEDGELSYVFFMLASPDNDDIRHIEALAQLSKKILEPSFINELKSVATVQAAIEIITADNACSKRQPNADTYDLLLQTHSPLKQKLRRFKEHLLFGTSHMIPFIVVGGVLLSISIMVSGQAQVPRNGILADIAQMGVAGLALFTVVLGGFIAFSIADKPGFAPGMIGSWIAVNHNQTGFIGAIFVGFFAGFIIRMLKKIPLKESMISLGSIFIYPLVGTFLTCGFVMWGIGKPIAEAMIMMDEALAGMAGSGKVLLGSVLGAMTALDMGGPINKVATLFAQTQIGTQPWLMGGVGIAICTPPLGMALATYLAPRKFKSEEREAGKAAGLMGIIGITEGAIPFATLDPLRVLPAIVSGAIVGNVIGFMYHVINHAPWGGWIVLPVIDGKLGYIVGTIAGSLTTAIIVILLKKTVNEEFPQDSEAPFSSLVHKHGEADIVAITSCPSGVSHTFLAARALEKAAQKHGIKIKVETQGANGINNQLTALDIEKAELVILAHDIGIKGLERFENMPTIDISTKEALYNAEKFVKLKS